MIAAVSCPHCQAPLSPGGRCPARTPATFADERKASSGTLPETAIPVTIEAAGYRGRPVLFEIVAPWSTTPREPGPASRQSGGSNPVFIYVLLGGSAVAAYLNVRRGRADRQGAFRLAAFTPRNAAWPLPTFHSSKS